MQVPQRENLLVGFRPHQGRCAGYSVHALSAHGGLEHRALGPCRLARAFFKQLWQVAEVAEAGTGGQHQGLGVSFLVN